MTVQLGRRFYDIGDGDELDESEALHVLPTAGESWSVVLARPCAVILGEAGSGKTTEFRLAHQQLVAEGKFSFALTVEDLAVLGVDGSLVGRAREQFEAWKLDGAEAYFFLDSIDESHLNGQRLSTALRRFASETRVAQQRARVMLSCRVSDWRAHTDRNTIDTILFPDADPNAIKPAKSSVRVYALAPLDVAQVHALATAIGVADAAAFSAAARRAGAHAYLERPRDVEWLAEYWQRYGEIGSLTSLVEHDVREKLVERNPSRETTLDPLRARRAAEVLAGVLTLERRATIRLPDGEFDPERAANALDPVRVLPDFSGVELRELLTRPLFDEATYGRVRIHHRSIVEYLAAQWFLRLLKSGMAESELRRLLFRPGPDGLVVPAELGPVAAWLAGTSVAVRRELIATAPEVLLQGGDPNSLPDETRRELLEAIASRYTTRDRLFQSFDPVMLRRLATGAIADTVTALLDSSKQSELLSTLLEVVEEGRLASCAESAIRIACDSKAPIYVRTAAVRAAAQAATAEQLERLLAGVIDRSDVIDHEMGGALVGSLYPSVLSIERLLVLIARVKAPPRNTGTLLPHYLGRDVPEKTSPADKLRLLEAVLAQLQVPDNPNTYVGNQGWLLDPLARMVGDFVTNRGELPLDLIVPSLRFFGRIGPGGRLDHESGGNKIRKVVAAHTDLKRQLFWGDVESLGSSPTTFFDMLRVERMWELADEDREWLARDAVRRQDPNERLLAFDCLLSAPCREGAAEVRNQVVEEIAEGDAAFKTHLQVMQARVAAARAAQLVSARRQERAEKRRAVRDDDLRWLTERVEGLRDGSEQDALTRIARHYLLDGEKPEAALISIAKDFGERIGEAVRDGWVRMWRGLRCPLPHEQRGTFDFVMVAGFAGITLEGIDGLDFARLTGEEAVAAARFASRAMNHFPDWLDALASKQPDAVKEVFGQCIEADFRMKAGEQPAHAVLALLPHASDEARQLCGPVVVYLLRSETAERFDSLKCAIEVVIATSTIHAEFGRFAGDRCRSDRDDAERYAVWWSAWLVADPESAIDELEASRRTAADPDQLLLTIANQLWLLVSDRVAPLQLPKDVRQVGRLALIVFTHIRPDDDLRHAGIYSPGPRDHAESLRHGILNMIENSPGESAYQVLKALAAEPALKSWEDYLLSLADKRLVLDAGAYDPEVANKLITAFQTHGLDAVNHLKEAGLMTTAADIGILTIREDEFQSVLAAFPQALGVIATNNRHYNIRRADAGGGKDYRVAVVRLAEQGNGEAADAARDLIDDLKPRMILVVGIAGGVPSDGFTLGDVVVATRVNDYNVRVEREQGDTEFELSGGPLARAVSSTVANLGAREEIRNWAQSLPSLPTLDPASIGTYGPTSWQERIRTSIEHHFGGGASRSPRFYAGPIASSDMLVMDTAPLILWLETARKLCAVEMESAGVYRATRERCAMLAIRGISDIVGLDREVVRQRFTTYACQAAAAFARAYLKTGPV